MFEVSVLRKKYRKKIEENFLFENMVDVVKCVSKFEKVKECTIFVTIDDVTFVIQTSDFITGKIKKYNWKSIAINDEILDEKIEKLRIENKEVKKEQ